MMPCPRRAETALVISPPSDDRWRLGNEARPHTCTYCGGLNPDEVLRRIEAGEEVTPTDKNYKMYIDQSSANWAKVYFQHFSDAHKARFIELLNAGKMKIGFPGHFYVPPFFVRFDLPPGTATQFEGK